MSFLKLYGYVFICLKKKKKTSIKYHMYNTVAEGQKFFKDWVSWPAQRSLSLFMKTAWAGYSSHVLHKAEVQGTSKVRPKVNQMKNNLQIHKEKKENVTVTTILIVGKLGKQVVSLYQDDVTSMGVSAITVHSFWHKMSFFCKMKTQNQVLGNSHLWTTFTHSFKTERRFLPVIRGYLNIRKIVFRVQRGKELHYLICTDNKI